MTALITKAKPFVKLLVPPFIWKLASKIVASRDQNRSPHNQVFEGPLLSFDNAVACSDGWDAPVITAKTLEAALKVKNNIIEYELDTQQYKKILYSPTILAFLLLALERNRENIHIIDFGGSLATNWFQNRKLLRKLNGISITWSIIERHVLVELGNKYFAIDNLRFFSTINDAVKAYTFPADFFLFSGSLQYLREPFATVDQVIESGAKIVAFDRLLVSPTDQHAIYIQHPNPNRHYPASYPVWCFSRDLFISHLVSKGFSVVEHFTSDPDAHFDHCGMLFVRQS